MSIVIHHGPPGSYKSSGVIQRFALPALKGEDKAFPDGRCVVTNVRGFDSVEKIEAALGIDLPSGAEIISLETETRDALETMGRWFHWAPPGALIIMDEAQAVYPAGRRDFKIEALDYPGGQDAAEADDRPADLLLAFDMHRHYNWDVYLCTPNIAKVHKEIRQSAQAAFRHWEMGSIVPWKRGKWREQEHDPENNGKAKSNAIGSHKEYKVDDSTFECYQSTKTGVAKEAVGDSIFKDPKLRIVATISVICIVAFVYQMFGVVDRLYGDPDKVDRPQAAQNDVVRDSDGGGDQRHSVRNVSRGDVARPLDRYELWMTGHVGDQVMLSMYRAGDEFSQSSSEIESMGYSVLLRSRCHAKLYHQGEFVQDLYCKPSRASQTVYASSDKDDEEGAS